MPFTIRCNNCKTPYDVDSIKPFTLPCNCGVVIERAKPHYRINFNHDKLNKAATRRNIFDNIKLISIGALIVVALVTLLAYASHIFESNSNVISNVLASKPHVRFEKGGLYIDDFNYSFGKIEINKSSGNFKELNRKVYDLLQDQSGNCKVYIRVENEDKYGNKSDAYVMKGTIDVSELKKYSNVDHWSKDGGMEKLLLH